MIRNIVHEWILLCRRKGWTEKIKEFELIIDFDYETMSESYYRKIAGRAAAVLDDLDTSKPEPKIVYDRIHPIVKKYLGEEIERIEQQLDIF